MLFQKLYFVLRVLDNIIRLLSKQSILLLKTKSVPWRYEGLQKWPWMCDSALLKALQRTVTKYPDGVALYSSCLTFEASKSFQAFTYRVIISATETIAITMAKETITAGAATTLAIYNSSSGSKSSDCKGNNNSNCKGNNNNNSNCKGNNNNITSNENIHFHNNIDNNTHLSNNNNSDR